MEVWGKNFRFGKNLEFGGKNWKFGNNLEYWKRIKNFGKNVNLGKKIEITKKFRSLDLWAPRCFLGSHEAIFGSRNILTCFRTS